VLQRKSIQRKYIPITDTSPRHSLPHLTSIQSPKEPPKKHSDRNNCSKTKKHQKKFLTKIDDGGGEKIKLQKAPTKCKPKNISFLA
jgi:hypothetical protein